METEKATREYLARVARINANKPFHGFTENELSNIGPIIAYFPKRNIIDADRMWCAAFVYYCCVQAGFAIPYSPKECVSCSLAGCGGWEEYALGDERIGYFPGGEKSFAPQGGDIVLYDNVFGNGEHDHIGIVLENKADSIVVAEGNYADLNISKIVERAKDGHIRAYIRIPDGYEYERS